MSAIYKRDLRAYFTSPVGYVFIAAFLFVMNLVFFLMNMLTGENRLAMCYTIMLYAMMILVPILTMRTFSEDYKQKTDQLLLTAPVRPAGIVMGKFLAAYTVFVITLALMLVQVVIIAAMSTPNAAIIIGNYIALLSAAAVYISIGCFISSLTENQLVANIATLAVNVTLFLLDYAYDLVNVGWIKQVLYWISVYRRFNTFYVGVFSVADFVFYLCVAAVFLFLTVRVLEKKRWS
jgi:ABC-2 type transport system permease protein